MCYRYYKPLLVSVCLPHGTAIENVPDAFVNVNNKGHGDNYGRIFFLNQMEADFQAFSKRISRGGGDGGGLSITGENNIKRRVST